MKLTKLQLENFRNYQSHDYVFDDKQNLTIFVGNNGIGKTNFLEAIHVLSLGQSFRSTNREDMIQWDKDYFRCKAEIANAISMSPPQENITKLEVFYSSQPLRQKSFKKNGVKMKSTEYLGNLITVLFHPEDLNMLYLSPSLRRRYMDTVLCQADRQYLDALINYKHVLKQRNALLVTIRKAQFDRLNTEHLLADLDIWDQEMIKFGTVLIEKRSQFVDFLNTKLEEIYNSIADEQATLEVRYLLQGDLDVNTTSSSYSELLTLRRSFDIRKAETSIGPHRDDLHFFLNAKNICRFASRGEFRTLLLAIKLAEIKFIEEVTGEMPILLLDDVFSELDRKRQKHLLETVKDYQTIITTTDMDPIFAEVPDSKIIEIERSEDFNFVPALPTSNK